MDPVYEAELETLCRDIEDREDQEKSHVSEKLGANNDSQGGEEVKWWDSESQYLLDSQQLVEGLSLCDEFLQSQSQRDDENQEPNGKPRLADYAQLGPESLKKDLEACQNLVLDPANIDIDTPPEFRLSQLVSSSLNM